MRAARSRRNPPVSCLLPLPPPSPPLLKLAREIPLATEALQITGFFFSYIDSKKRTYIPKGDVQTHAVTRLLLISQCSLIGTKVTSQGLGDIPP